MSLRAIPRSRITWAAQRFWSGIPRGPSGPSNWATRLAVGKPSGLHLVIDRHFFDERGEFNKSTSTPNVMLQIGGEPRSEAVVCAASLRWIIAFGTLMVEAPKGKLLEVANA